MIKLTLFNTLSGIIAAMLVVARFGVRRLERYLSCKGWTYMKYSFDLTCLAQLGALVNLLLLPPGLNWLAVALTIARAGGVSLFAVSIFLLEDMLHDLFTRLKQLGYKPGVK